MSTVEISPIVKTIDVRRSARDAFRLFTEEITAWWPIESHSRAKSAAGEKTERVTIEPRVGGRVYETLNDGRELDWGEVTAYEPGDVFAMEWRMGRTPEEATQVTVHFETLDEESCRVSLTHENWERLGEEAESQRDGYNNGWVAVFEEGFGGFAGRA